MYLIQCVLGGLRSIILSRSIHNFVTKVLHFHHILVHSFFGLPFLYFLGVVAITQNHYTYHLRGAPSEC